MRFFKWFLLCMLGSLAITNTVQANSTIIFTDVHKTDEGYHEIHYIANAGVISGYTSKGQQIYKPANNITRAQASKMLVIATGNEKHNGSHIQLKDVISGSEQEYYIKKAVSLGYFKLQANGNFYPNEFVKRSELATALATAFNLSEPVTMNRPLHFNDVKRTDSYATAVNALYYAGISQGDQGAFGPNRFLTRKHFALFVARAMNSQYKLKVKENDRPAIIGKGKVTVSSLNVRSSRAINNKNLIGSLKKNDTFEIIGKHDQWLEINYYNRPAYISSSAQYIELLDADGQAVGPIVSVVQVEPNTASLNVRSLPSVAGNIIGSFKRNETIVVYGEKNGWYLTTFDGIPGYVNSQYTLDVTESNPSSPTLNNVLGKVTVDSLNVRFGPGDQFPIVGKLRRDQKVNVQSLDGYWAQIDFDGAAAYVHKSYLKLINLSNSPLKDRIIVLDAGHGGTDPGASGNGIIEKELALDVAKRVEAKLKKAGAKVLMTRANDSFLSLQERTDFAKKHYAETFVSIHGNAFVSSAQGTEVFYDTSKNPNGDESKQLAQYIQNQIVKMANMTDRGIKDTGFYVIRNNNVASVLVELGFMTNEEDAAKLKEHPDIFAEAIYQGIVQYYSTNE